MTPLKTALAAGLIAVFAAPAALADPPGRCPDGYWDRGKCDWRTYERDREHRQDDRREDRAYEQGYRDAQRDAWRKGDHLRGDDVRYVVIDERDYGRYNLSPPPRGQYYAEVDGQVLLVQTATQLILQAIGG
jgi:Ni/Co efflux regulator RcnB